MSSLAVFAGPSLPLEDRIVDARVAYLAPAARGDMETAAAIYDAILLIDGVFHHALAPSPRECARVARACRAFGAASMGALRAAECAPYGFLPLGAIACWYARGLIDGDDEVAVLTDAAGTRALTVPSVNVRYAARVAARHGWLTPAEAAAWVTRARSISYAERTWPAALMLAPERARTLLGGLSRERLDLKRRDARFALRSTLRRLRDPAMPPGGREIDARSRP